MTTSGLNCENCGSALPRRLKQARMITCPHCGSTSVLKDDAFYITGHGGTLQQAPSLVELGVPIKAGRETLLPVGHAQFGYGRGWWDEYWCLDEQESGCWLSADEGDYAIERPLPESDWPHGFRATLGAHTAIQGKSFTVTEAETATCLAIRGEFPEDIALGEAHLYYDLTGESGLLATYERWEDDEAWTIGKWIDPWDVHNP